MSSAAAPKLLALSISDLVHSSRFYFQDIFKLRWDLANSIHSFCNNTVWRTHRAKDLESFFT